MDISRGIDSTLVRSRPGAHASGGWGWLAAVALAGVLSACGGGDTDAPAAAVVPAQAGSADIDAAGGSVDAVLEGGTTVRLDVPADALDAKTTFRIDPRPAASGSLGAFTLSPAGAVLLKPVTLTVSLPAGPSPDPDTSLVIVTTSRPMPVGATIDVASRTITVRLDALVLQSTASALRIAPGRATPLAAPSTAAANAVLLFDLQRMGYPARVLILESFVTDLAARGSNDNAVLVRTVMESVLSDPRGPSDPKVHSLTPTWRNVVCGQQQFSLSALNTFTGVDIQTFEQRARDVVIWDRHALDLNRLDAQMSPSQPGCAGVPADFLEPVRARLPTFLADVRNALGLLDPTVKADYSQLFGVRFADMLNLAADFGRLGADDLESATFGVVASELARVRAVAYTECRVHRLQTVQSKLLKEALINEIRSPFHGDDVLEDIQFCGMPLHWKLVDGQDVVLQQGDAGGSGPGVTIAAVSLQATSAARIVLSGPVSALVCPAGSQNNEQLAFSAGPAGGPFTVVKQVSPSNANGYLESGTLDIDVLPLLQQGAEQLVVARQGGLCNGEFVTLGRHSAVATFALNRTALQIATARLPDATVGAAYSATVAASGGRTPLVWSATGLPAGLSLDAQTGQISGTLTVAATTAVRIGVTSADGQSAQRSVSLTVSAPTTFVGSVTEKRTSDILTSNAFEEFRVIQTQTLGFTNVVLVQQADGSFVASGTVSYTLTNERITTDGCRVVISRLGSGPVTSYDGRMPSSPGGALKGSVTFVETTTVEPCPARGLARDSLVRSPQSFTALPEQPPTPVFVAGNLVELNWNFVFSGAGTTTVNLVGSVKVAP